MRYLATGQQMARLDRQTIEDYGIPGRALMETAGRAVAQVAAHAAGHEGQIMWGTPRERRRRTPVHLLVACGGGNNGGDGFVAARLLAGLGFSVDVFIFADHQRLAGDALATFRSLEKIAETRIHFVSDIRVLREFETTLLRATLVIDALLGIGAKGEVHGMMRECISFINKRRVPVVSVDIATGICADTGVVLGEAIRASHTVTFGLAKRGHYLYPGAAHRGTLHVADIGLPHPLVEREKVATRVMLAEDGPRLFATRKADTHKGTYGHLVVLAGSAKSPGAAMLCLNAALRTGAGLVSLACDEHTLTRSHNLAPEVMLRIRESSDDAAFAELLVQQATALVIGPGLGQSPAMTALLEKVFACARVPMCLDADALNALAETPALWERIPQVPVVITPHPKEMARLMQMPIAEVQKDRIGVAQACAQLHRCTVVLKGAGTVVADPDGQVVVVAAGNAGLARGGTGDVLAGMVGALLAQHVPAMRAAEAAVVLHGAAGDEAASRLGQTGMSVSDVIEALATVLHRWQR